MGASLIHGRRLEKQPFRSNDGRVGEELIPVEGNWAFPSYSSVERLVQFCEARGIPRAWWPIFYDIRDGDVSLDEVRRRCDALREPLATLSDEESTAIPWLAVVRDLLRGGEVFAVFE